jgi:hypothetical protein
MRDFSIVIMVLFIGWNAWDIAVNKKNIQESFVSISDLAECMTELDQRMDSMEDRPEISISYGTVITTEDEIIIQEEARYE